MDVARLAQSIRESADVLTALAELAPEIHRAGELLTEAIAAGGKIMLCGNGGSAADSQHFATELAVRYLADRPAIPAIALTTDTSVLTAASNDLGFERVFARQVEALGRPEDALVAISTSGNSENVLAAVKEARARGIRTVGLTGRSGGALADAVDACVRAPSDHTPRIQEAHLVVEHLLCEQIEAAVAERTT